MKKVSFLTLSILMLYTLSVFRIYLPYINYWINYDYISTQLCENKDKPEMHCDGKCCLEKELKQAAVDDGKEKSTSAPEKIIVFQEMPSSALSLNFILFLISKNNFQKNSSGYFSPVIEITSPPPDLV